MKCSIIQLDAVFAAPAENRLKIEKFIRMAAKEHPDVIVLPEMWNTGFFPDNVSDLADVDGEPTCEMLTGLARELGVNIVGGSVANIENKELVNSSFIVNREGQVISKYNKIHLFSPSGEDRKFTAGKAIGIFEMDGVKAGLLICYDVRFPELARTLALKGAQIVFIPAEWPHPRLEHWQTLIKARAIENQMFVVAVNGVGKAKELKFCGNSMAIDPWGHELYHADESESVAAVEMDLRVINDIRDRINVFRDRKPELYEVMEK